MTVRRRDLAAACRLNAARLNREPAPAEVALGIVKAIAPVSACQASAMVACWWPGWDVAVLAALLEGERFTAIALHYRPPTQTRRWYAEAARATGLSPLATADAVARGTEALYGWLASRDAPASMRETDEVL